VAFSGCVKASRWWYVEAMNSPVKPKLVVVAACLIGVGALRADAASPAGTQSQGAEVMAVQAVTYCFADTIGVTGFLVPREEAIVNLDDGYRISETLVKEGATVANNQDLVRLTRLETPTMPGAPAPPGARPGPATIVLKAPVAGLITRSTAVVGAVASPRAEPLFRIMINGEIELEVDVPSIHVTKLKADGRQTARVEVENGTELSGRVRLVPGEINPMTQLGRVRLSIDRNPTLRVGMFARAAIDASRSCGVAVPRSAVSYRTEGTSVQLIRDGVVKSQPIVTGLTSDTDIEIKNGVTEGDVIVASAGTSLHDGDAVKPVYIKRPAE
jgi:multidrug efflux pump subunit AcrA (membrane-fusion protein)